MSEKWRECVYAGPATEVGTRGNITTYVSTRGCGLNRCSGTVTVGTCATCPVPALVEAVRAVVEKPFTEAYNLAVAALAALPEEGKSE